MGKEYMVVNWDLKNKTKEDYYVTSVWEVWEKSKKQMSWDLFKKSIRMKNLETKRLEEIPDIDNLKEHTILVTPILAQHGKITKITSQLLNERGDDFKDGVKSGYYVYSKNYGWIDRGHAGFFNKENTDNHFKLRKLYNQILIAKKSSTIEYFQISGFKGIKVNHAVMDITINKDIQGIEDEKKRFELAQGITLSIFKKVSMEFEKNQKLTELFKESSFAEEDLPSNILDFYFEVMGYSEKYIRNLCDCFSEKQSLWIYHQYKFKKNDDFAPILRYPSAKSPTQFDDIKEIDEGDESWRGVFKFTYPFYGNIHGLE